MKKISIIVPVYKVEDYLDRCIKSIVQQTYNELEIILVDDGSPDGCPHICDIWREKDNRIRVIHQPNGGLSEARNTGIDASEGDYLLFVDSDDYIEPAMCEKLLQAAEKFQADVTVCNFFYDYSDRVEKYKTEGISGRIISKEQILEELFLKENLSLLVAWGSLYRRNLFFSNELIRYPKGLLHEDEFTTYRLLYAGKKTIILNEAYYHYVQHDDSIMAKFNEKNLHDCMLCAQEYLHWADKYAPEKRKIMEYAALRMCRAMIGKCEERKNLKFYSSKISAQAKVIAKQLDNFMNNPYADWKAKVSFIAILFEKYRYIKRVRNCFRIR